MWSRKRSNRRRIRLQHVLFTGGVLVFGMILGVILFAYFVGGQIYEYQETMSEKTVEQWGLPDVEVIVCLAGGKGRIREASDLWYRYWRQSQIRPATTVPILYISGMGHQAGWKVMIQQVSEEVLEVLKPQYVFIENESENTEENAYLYAKNAAEKGWKRLALVTASYHLPRAHYVFDRTLRQSFDGRNRKFRIETRALAHDPFNSANWYFDITGIRITILEYLKWQYYRVIWKRKDWGQS